MVFCYAERGGWETPDHSAAVVFVLVPLTLCVEKLLLRDIGVVNRIELEGIFLAFILWIGDANDIIPVSQRGQFAIIGQGQGLA